jgi:hypothetical protein
MDLPDVRERAREPDLGELLGLGVEADERIRAEVAREAVPWDAAPADPADKAAITPTTHTRQTGRSRANNATPPNEWAHRPHPAQATRARSSSSAWTALVTVRVNLTSSWIACTRNTEALRSAVAVDLPDQAVVVEYREGEVAPAALRRGLVHLKGVLEVSRSHRRGRS